MDAMGLVVVSFVNRYSCNWSRLPCLYTWFILSNWVSMLWTWWPGGSRLHWLPELWSCRRSKFSKFLGQLLRSSGSDWHQQQHVGYVVNCPKIIHGATTTKWPMGAKLNPQGRVDSKQVMRWSWDDPKWCPRQKKKKWVTDVGRFGWKRLEWIF